MMSLEARTLLDRNSLITAREKSRMYGNIDAPHMRPLSQSEIIFLVMKVVFSPDNIQKLYEVNDSFYDRIKTRGLSQGIQRD